MSLKIKKRCIRCLTVLKEDGTCPNKKCPKYKYIPDKQPERQRS